MDANTGSRLNWHGKRAARGNCCRREQCGYKRVQRGCPLCLVMARGCREDCVFPQLIEI